MWGQLHPWERARVPYDAWRRMLLKVTKAHVDADSALRGLFPDDERHVTSFSFDEFHERDELAKRRQRDFYDAINGDGPRVLELMCEFGEAEKEPDH